MMNIKHHKPHEKCKKSTVEYYLCVQNREIVGRSVGFKKFLILKIN